VSAAPRRRRTNRSSSVAKPRKPVDIWRPAPALPEAAPIAPVTEPTAMIRSLGDPPLPDGSVVAGHYVAAVVERAATLASALAASAGLLADDDEDGGEAPDDTASPT